ncbi:MAG: DUF2848 family protein [Roseibium sp.]|nr:DUF2848 family protein [Roseibium sp.]
MTNQIDVQVSRIDGSVSNARFAVKRMYNFGSATRDPQVAVAHQEEVAKSGIHIAFDVPAPRIYPIALQALTSDDEVLVQSDRTSGEVEIVIHVGDEIYVGVGSDHTDRALETVSIPGSKQAVVNHLAPVFWPYDEIRDSWDDCVLKSWVDDRLYQDVGVSAFLRPEDIIALLRERVNGVPDRDFMIYCGTIVSVDKALGFGTNWRYQIDSPSTGRRIGATYQVVDILAEIKPEFRVPFFNPKRGNAA